MDRYTDLTEVGMKMASKAEYILGSSLFYNSMTAVKPMGNITV